MAETTIRTTVVLPKELMEKLKRHVPARRRSAYIADVLRRNIEQQEFLEALDAAAGICKEEDYPHWRTPEDVRNYLRDMGDPKNGRRTLPFAASDQGAI